MNAGNVCRAVKIILISKVTKTAAIVLRITLITCYVGTLVVDVAVDKCVRAGELVLRVDSRNAAKAHGVTFAVGYVLIREPSSSSTHARLAHTMP